VTVVQRVPAATADAVAREIQDALGLADLPAVVSVPTGESRSGLLRIGLSVP
jgi:hypothetical protein